MSITVSGLERNCGLDQHIEHFAFDIDAARKIDDAAGDFQIDLRTDLTMAIFKWL
jgi:hypothetical protein